jgi:NADPH:quinone reductase-like Zn-dependent oxidoreductase
MKQVLPVSFPLTIGQDFAGEVTDRGKAVKRFRHVDRLFGFAQGAYAEYAAAPESTVAAIPDSIDYATAAALPPCQLQYCRPYIRLRWNARLLRCAHLMKPSQFQPRL